MGYEVVLHAVYSYFYLFRELSAMLISSWFAKNTLFLLKMETAIMISKLVVLLAFGL